MRIFWNLICLFIFPLSLIGQINLDNTTYNSFFYEDQKGQIWVSSEKGWHVYDGNDTFFHSISVTTGIQGSWIQSTMYKDNTNLLWFTTYEYLVKYDPKLNEFQSYKISVDSIGAYHLFHFEKGTNKLWVATEKEIILVDPNAPSSSSSSSSSQRLDVITNSRRFRVIENDKGFVQKIYGTPWLQGFGIEIYENNEQGWEVNALFEEYKNKKLIVSDIVIVKSIVNLITDHGIVSYDPLTSSAELYKLPNKNLVINSALEFENDILCTVTGAGLMKFDLESKKYLTFPAVRLASNSFRELFKDSKGNIFISHRNNGVQKISSLELDSSFEVIKTDETVLKIVEARNGLSTLSADSRSVSHYTKTFKHVSGDNGTQKDGLFLNLYSVNGDLWTITALEAFKYSTTQSNWESVLRLDSSIFFNLSSGVEDLPIAVTNEGVFKFDFIDGAYILKPCKKENEQTKNSARDIIYFSKEEFCALTLSTSFLYSNQDTTLQEDVGSYINNVCRVKDNLFFATQGGLFQMDSEFNVKQLFASPFELGTQEIYKLQKDHSQNLWALSESGLYKVTSDLKSLIRISTLPYNELDKEFLIDNNNNIVLSAKGKLMRFPLSSIVYDTTVAVSIISEFLVNNQSSLDLIDKNLIELRHDQNNLSISLKIVDTSKPENASVYYRIPQHDTTWNIYNSDIKLPGLQTGEFTFEYMSSGSNGLISNLSSLEVIVKPPFYNTWWFKAFIMMGLISIGFLISYLKSKSELRKIQIELDKQAALQKQRQAMSQDLHDEMGSGLASIKFLVQNDSKNETERNSQISLLASSLISSMRDLLWSLDESNETAEKLASKIRHTAGVLTKGTGLESKTNISISGKEKVSFSAMERRNLILILKEAITNVLKHSKATKLDVTFSINQGKAILVVQDNGIGFDRESISEGVGLSSIEKRCMQLQAIADINSNKMGTTYRISLPQK